MRETESQKHGRIRELVLRIALQSYPNPIDAELLRATLSNLGYPLGRKELATYTSYLQERGYLAVEERPEFEIVLVKLTAHGMDALDKRIKDCGIGC
jgi:hypothetical protein